MVRLIVSLYLLLALLLVISPAVAQETLNVRTGIHPSYSRIVFDWQQKTGFKTTLDGRILRIQFDRAGDPDLEEVEARQLANIGNVRVVSAEGAPLAVEITIADGSDFRHFAIGNRVVFDVLNPQGQGLQDAEGRRAVVEKTPVSKQAKEKTKVSTGKAPKVPSKRKSLKKASPQKVTAPASAQRIEKEVLDTPITRPHIITLTATETFGMAAFARSGWLWLVVDRPHFPIPPQLSGPQKKLFSGFEQFDIEGGTAFRTALPGTPRLYGEGGGLLWRVVVTPNEREVEPPVAVEREFDQEDPVRGGVLLWPMRSATKVLTLKDPQIGDMLTVVTVEESDKTSGPEHGFVELKTLDMVIGLGLMPKTDDLEARLLPEGVAVSRPGGLALGRQRDTLPVLLNEQAQRAPGQETASLQGPPGEADGHGGQDGKGAKEARKNHKKKMRRIYNFESWEMGGIKDLRTNQAVLMAGLHGKDQAGKTQDLLTLAKLNLANSRGVEALGLLRVARQETENILESPEYIALRGAANALAGKMDEAIVDLSVGPLKKYDELDYWRAYALAGLEDWRQAAEIMPESFDVLASYPQQIRDPLILKLSEVALRAGKTMVADGLLTMLEDNIEDVIPPYVAAWRYLKGEVARQKGKMEEAVETWKELSGGKDDLYRAKAGLALTRLELEEKKINPKQAVDRLEGLRYAWRGDELETLINFRLGEVYVDNGNFLKGLFVLRNTVSLSPESILAREIAGHMTDVFESVFSDEKLKEISPLEAVSIYEEFQELTPPGRRGDTLISALAERLVQADLLERASELLEHQIKHRLKGDEAADTAMRLAAIKLIDKKPEAALKVLDAAAILYKGGKKTGRVPADKQRNMTLLRARAYSQKEEPDQALDLLETLSQGEDVNRLRADVAWADGRWEEAGEALLDLILAEDISLTRPLTPRQAELILNRAVALNLARDRVSLANLRERYSDAMRQTDKFDLFEVVTRPHQIGFTGSREAIMTVVSEVDMFKSFLDAYRSTKTP